MTQTQSSLRIAIIEDEAIVAFEMEAHLTDGGHEVVGVVDTLEDAIRLVDDTRPDLALIDIQLANGLSGLTVAHALHERGIPCLFSTGNCPGKQSDDAVGCLHKPFGPLQLLDAVKATIAIARGEEPKRVPNEMHIYR